MDSLPILGVGELPGALRGIQSDLDDIREALRSDSLILPVIGSGLSVGLQSWRELLESIAAKAKVEIPTLDPAGDPKDWMDWADRVAEAAGKAHIANTIKRLYSDPAKSGIPRPPVYDALAALPIKQFATTNFDPWIQLALAERRESVEPLDIARSPAELGKVGDRSLVVVHLHGRAHDSVHCVVTKSQYASLMGHEAFKQGMSGLMVHRRLLFLGYSLRDPDFLFMLEQWREIFQAAGTPTKHWILDASFEDDRVRLLRDMGIEPVPYGDHANLTAILKYLAHDPKSEGALATASVQEVRTGHALNDDVVRALGQMKFDSALDLLETKAHDRQPSETEVYTTAWLHWARDDPREALRALDRARSVVDGSPQLLLLNAALANACEEPAKEHTAIDRFTSILRNTPEVHLQRVPVQTWIEHLQLANRQLREAAIAVDERVRLGQTPWLSTADLFELPYRSEWRARCEGPHTSDDPAARVRSTIYSSHGGLPHVDDFREWELPDPGHGCVVDESALLTLDRLDLLDLAREHFGTLHVPSRISEELGKDQTALAVHTTGIRRLLREAIDASGEDCGEVVTLVDLAPHLVDVDESLPTRLVPVAGDLGVRDIQKHQHVVLSLSDILAAGEFGIAGPIAERFRVHLSQADVSSARAILRRLENREQHRVEQRAFVERIRRRVTVASAETDTGTLFVDRSQASAELALGMSLPLLADDRFLQAVVHHRSQGRLAAFGSHVLIAGFVERKVISAERGLELMLRLMEWGYRFLPPPKWLWPMLRRVEGDGFPGDRSQQVVRYLHDCLRDPGLLHGTEPTDPPRTQALAYWTEWTRSLRSLLCSVWECDENAEELRTRVTRWVLREATPPPLWLAGTTLEERMARSWQDAFLVSVLFDQVRMRDRELASRFVAAVVATLGSSMDDLARGVVTACTELAKSDVATDEKFDLRPYVVAAALPPLKPSPVSAHSLLRTLALPFLRISDRWMAEVTEPILDVNHPRRWDDGTSPYVRIAPNSTADSPPVIVGSVVELLHATDSELRLAALDQVGKVCKHDPTALAAATHQALDEHRAAIASDNERTWAGAAVALDQCLSTDWNWHLVCLRHALAHGSSVAVRWAFETVASPSLPTLQRLLQEDSPTWGQDPRSTPVVDVLSPLHAAELHGVTPLDQSVRSMVEAVRQMHETKRFPHGTWKRLQGWSEENPATRERLTLLVGMRIPSLIPDRQRKHFCETVIRHLSLLVADTADSDPAVRIESLLAQHFYHHAIALDPAADAGTRARLAWQMSRRVSDCLRVVPERVQVLADFERKFSSRAAMLAALARSPLASTPLARITSTIPTAAWPLTLLTALREQGHCLDWMTDRQLGEIHDVVRAAHLLMPHLHSTSVDTGDWEVLFRAVRQRVESRGTLSTATTHQERASDSADTALHRHSEHLRTMSRHRVRLDASHFLSLYYVLVTGSEQRSSEDYGQERRPDIWDCLPSDPCEFGSRLVELDLSMFESWIEKLAAIPPSPGEPGKVAQYLAGIAESPSLDAVHAEIVFAAMTQACIRDGTHRAVARIRESNAGLWLRAGRTVRTVLAAWLDHAPPWLAGRMRAVLAELPREGLTGEDLARLQRRSERVFGQSKVSTRESVDGDPGVADLDARLRAAWKVSLEAWGLNGNSWPSYVRDQAPGVVWRDGAWPPDHVA